MRKLLLLILIIISIAELSAVIYTDESQLRYVYYPQLEFRDTALLDLIKVIIRQEKQDPLSVDDDYVLVFPTKKELKRTNDTIVHVYVVDDEYDAVTRLLKRKKDIRGGCVIEYENSDGKKTFHGIMPIGNFEPFFNFVKDAKPMEYIYNIEPFMRILYEGRQMDIRLKNGKWEIVPGSRDWF